ncbi:hypothetical protein D4764_06G0007570 [Takifugu flavidus]|uniref:Uncharacterized protein n=1 Tax=Takifugu flavidus TaxID=433684 RepID=A0A5C6N0M0_9TELE|nr:hypothetical protein D4764_06G0007570 [Takifugu flavidus]
MIYVYSLFYLSSPFFSCSAKLATSRRVFPYEPGPAQGFFLLKWSFSLPLLIIVGQDQKTVVVIDVAIPSDSNIRKKEHEKLEKYQGLKEEIERMWGMKATVVPVVIGTLGAVAPKLSRWLQQIPGTTSEISVQKSAVLGTAKILHRTLRLPGLW